MILLLVVLVMFALAYVARLYFQTSAPALLPLCAYRAYSAGRMVACGCGRCF